ncbi:hypothetical protein CH373_07290 [Leptospira perolatii]|uniref:Uncharacterized protein n=1 Tax=Leptospira perolatii TaxID=2023191 RepID=A0A2M9ZPB9_9LEPT|nr:hypothetical protein [Leptospira perolatii]PJZ70723.1 hypothetical protein CH360_04150 [Leptospira perolatii]PJZ73932.1 hypothetical protein CH373_07290 [Leptospira perolatii]
MKAPTAPSTPFFRILFVMGFLSLVFFVPLYLVVRGENVHQAELYKSLTGPGKKEFGVLTEKTNLEKLGRTVHLYTYLVSDEFGKKHEVTEEVDEQTHLRLRVGDTVNVRCKTWTSLGKRRLIARILGNKAPTPNFHFMEILFLNGIAYSLLIIGIGTYYRIFKAAEE